MEKVRATQAGMEELGARLAEVQPEVLVMISPHSPIFRDVFTVKNVPRMEGSFAAFQKPQIRIAKNNDMELVHAMLDVASREGFALEGISVAGSSYLSGQEELDHGLLVPLYYLDQYIETPIISLSISGLGYDQHFRLGRMVREACTRLGRRAFFVASGDLSHRLIRGAPAGYSPRGQEFDRRIVEIVSKGDFDKLGDIPEDLVQEAGECGFRSIHTMWGALKDGALKSRVLSYEGPFGVGYLVSLGLKDQGGDA
jgi:aromatic ring-opening dioxygenase LigB subunit